MFSNEEERTEPVVPGGVDLAPFWRRIVGVLVDQLVITAPVFAVFYAFGYSPVEAVTDDAALWFTIAIVTVGLVYETLLIWRWQRTIGKLLCGTRVVAQEDAGTIGFTRSFQRSLVPTALGAIPQVGPLIGIGLYSWAFMDPLRQGVHDKAAGSLVVLGHKPLQ